MASSKRIIISEKNAVNFGESIVQVTVGKGSGTKAFLVDEAVLCTKSEFFRIKTSTATGLPKQLDTLPEQSNKRQKISDNKMNTRGNNNVLTDTVQVPFPYTSDLNMNPNVLLKSGGMGCQTRAENTMVTATSGHNEKGLHEAADDNSYATLVSKPRNMHYVPPTKRGTSLPAKQEVEVKAKTVELPFSSPRAFNIYLEFRMMGRISLLPETAGNSQATMLMYDTLLDLYLLCKKIEDAEATDAVFNAVLEESRDIRPKEQGQTFPSLKQVEIIYNGTQGPCAMRKLLVKAWHWIVLAHPQEWNTGDPEKLPKAFWIDLCQSLVASSKPDGVGSWGAFAQGSGLQVGRRDR